MTKLKVLLTKFQLSVLEERSFRGSQGFITELFVISSHEEGQNNCTTVWSRAVKGGFHRRGNYIHICTHGDNNCEAVFAGMWASELVFFLSLSL